MRSLGLFNRMYVRCFVREIGSPFTVTISSMLTRVPRSTTMAPLMRTHPLTMSSSARRRDATPASAIALFRRTGCVGSMMSLRFCLVGRCLPEGTEESLRLRAGASLRLRVGASLRLCAGASPRLRAEEAFRFEDEDEELPRRSEGRFRGLGMAIHIVSKSGLKSSENSIDVNPRHTLMCTNGAGSSTVGAARTA